MEYIVAMFVVMMGPSINTPIPTPAVIQGFENQHVCEQAIVELKKQVGFQSAKCVVLPKNVAALEHGLSIDGRPFAHQAGRP